ncbi:MAG: AAA family ATPase [Ornithinimicrobium sp.]|uniref:AAA family ATPase n=1 Tax=Ornithinimicrobium sp. TaxID=1977084 RepID=UPI0026DEF0B2|nr:AAA family ATPase [Ornithinimicrobium sp.]MDO5740552.1 AAA family ATPase [Ornithinimicrobium sp.]
MSAISPAPDTIDLDAVRSVAGAIHSAITTVIEGKDEVVSTAVTVLMAEGHLLVEDVPGVGKTMLAKALARAIDCKVSRVQFTPDLLPSDITGVSIFNQESREFEFRRGAVFANVVVGDEINRASPKTQSALLEAMEERQVTVDGTTYPLPRPFLVMATQNPIEMEGTYPLPEAQRDRFMARLSMGYPATTAEIAMLESHGALNPLDSLHPVTTAEDVQHTIEAIRGLHTADALLRYVVDIVNASRQHRQLRLGASPRAGLQLLRAARAHAALAGRDHVLPEDVQTMAVPVLAHRILPTSEAALARHSTTDLVRDLLGRTAVPSGR